MDGSAARPWQADPLIAAPRAAVWDARAAIDEARAAAGARRHVLFAELALRLARLGFVADLRFTPARRALRPRRCALRSPRVTRRPRPRPALALTSPQETRTPISGSATLGEGAPLGSVPNPAGLTRALAMTAPAPAGALLVREAGPATRSMPDSAVSKATSRPAARRSCASRADRRTDSRRTARAERARHRLAGARGDRRRTSAAMRVSPPQARTRARPRSATVSTSAAGREADGRP